MPTLTDEVAALADLSTDDLAARYESEFGRKPRAKHRRYLIKRLSAAIQRRRQPVLSKEARAVLDSLIADLDVDFSKPRTTVAGSAHPMSSDRAFQVGSCYVRRWRDRDLKFTVVAHGVEIDATVHRSMSAAIRAATGSRWNPSLFLFGRREARTSP